MAAKSPNIPGSEQEVINLLLPFFYFDIFSYPLSLEEVFKYSHHENITKDRINNLINELVESKILFRFNDFYALRNNAHWVTERLENNERAKLAMVKADKMTKLISKFPFVRAVFISGSLSKNIMTESGDVDYFIITKSGYLWICRSLLILYKKLFLLNSHKYFCLNYFIDEHHLRIEEKNIFTATEIITMMPLYGLKNFEDFHRANNWVNIYYPNFMVPEKAKIPEFEKPISEKIMQFPLYGKMGNYLDTFFMKLTLKYWYKKFPNFDKEQFNIALKSKPYVSKHHPSNFQLKVLDAYQSRIAEFENSNKIFFDAKR